MGVRCQLGSCGATPAIPNRSRLGTHLPCEDTGTREEMRAFAPGQASAEHLPSCHLVPEAPHSLTSRVSTRVSEPAPRSTGPGPEGLPSLGFSLNQSSYIASGSQQVPEVVQPYSCEITPELQIFSVAFTHVSNLGTVTLLST